MKTRVYLGLAIRIIILFSIGMFWTFIPEQLFDFFGDEIKDTSWGTRQHVWGARHYWYSIMMALLFILSLVNIILQGVSIINNNYETKKW